MRLVAILFVPEVYEGWGEHVCAGTEMLVVVDLLAGCDGEESAGHAHGFVDVVDDFAGFAALVGDEVVYIGPVIAANADEELGEGLLAAGDEALDGALDDMVFLWQEVGEVENCGLDVRKVEVGGAGASAG